MNKTDPIEMDRESESFFDRSKRLAGQFGATAKSAAELTLKQAEYTKIQRVSLPQAFTALGKEIYSSGQYRDEFPQAFDELDRLQAEVDALETQARTRPVGEKILEKAKAAAASATDRATATSQRLQVSRRLSKLGQAVHAKHGKESGPAALTEPIASLLARSETLSSDIDHLSAADQGKLVTPKRLALGGVVLSGAVVLLLLAGFAGWFSGPSSNDVAHPVDPSPITDGGGTNSSGTVADGSSTLGGDETRSGEQPLVHSPSNRSHPPARKPPVGNERFEVPRIGLGLGEGPSKVLAAIRNQKTNFNQLKEIRHQFWKAYPDGPNLDSLRQDYAEVLLEKDVLLLYGGVTTGPDGFMGKLNRMTLDGGVKWAAKPAFDRWVVAMRAHMGIKENQRYQQFENLNALDPSKFDAAFQATLPHARQYTLLRDWHEFYEAGREQDFFPTAEAFGVFVGQTVGDPIGQEQAIVNFRELPAGRRPAFALFQRQPNELQLAIQRYLQPRLPSNLPQSEMKRLSDRIADKIRRSPIPELYRWKWFSGEGSERVLSLSLIRHVAQGSRSPKVVRQAADQLVDQIQDCFDPLLLTAIRGLWKSNPGPAHGRFPEGFAKRFERPRPQGPGALRGEKLMPAFHYIEFGPGNIRDNVRITESLPKHVATADVIQASYTDRGGPIYFWYKKYPDGFEALKKQWPASHPLLKIRPPVAAAPDRHPG